LELFNDILVSWKETKLIPIIERFFFLDKVSILTKK
jgi:hypothetical protein